MQSTTTDSPWQPLAAIGQWMRWIGRLPGRITRWLWWPVQTVYMRHERLRRAVAWARLHRRRLTATLFFVFHALGILSSFSVLSEPRTPQGAIAWIISLNTFPYAAVPLYWTIGETDYSEYAIAYRDRQASGAPILARLNDDLQRQSLTAAVDNPTKTVLTRLVNLPLTRGNAAEVLVDGVATFDAIFDSIQAARSYVLVEFYILRDDEIGRRFQQLLIDKAKSGVAVKLLYDEYGSRDLPSEYLETLRDAGVHVWGFNPPFEDVSPTRLNFRNHRKIVVVDGNEAFVGGHNIGDEYLSGVDELGHYRDTHVQLRGPIVQCVQVVFAEDWHAVTEELLETLNWQPQASAASDLVGLCLPSGPADELETASMFFLQAINSATDRIWIASPYFVPDHQMVTALQSAALRGVDVRILIPQKSDSQLVWLSSYSYLPELETAGIRTFRYRGRFMHQKTILVDDHLASIGTANFDNRSFRLNFEVMVVMFDQDFAAEVAQMLEQDFDNSRLAAATDLTDASLLFQYLVHGARLLAPIQ